MYITRTKKVSTFCKIWPKKSSFMIGRRVGTVIVIICASVLLVLLFRIVFAAQFCR